MSALNLTTTQDVSQDPGTHPIGYMDQNNNNNNFFILINMVLTDFNLP